MKNEDLIIRFTQGFDNGKGSNLRIEGDYLINYNTIIAIRRPNNVILLNTKKYSQTTSRHQNYIKNMGCWIEILECENEQVLLEMSKITV